MSAKNANNENKTIALCTSVFSVVESNERPR